MCCFSKDFLDSDKKAFQHNFYKTENHVSMSALLIWGNTFILLSCSNQMETSKTNLEKELYNLECWAVAFF